MTTWQEFKQRRPLRGAAARAYEQERGAMGVGYLILKARAEAGLSQAALARKIGTSQAMIARWESGSQMPNIRSLMRIAEATGYDLAVGLHARRAPEDRFAALGIMEARRGSFKVVREEPTPYAARPKTKDAKAQKKRSPTR